VQVSAEVTVGLVDLARELPTCQDADDTESLPDHIAA
jgi:hypothetical protein